MSTRHTQHETSCHVNIECCGIPPYVQAMLPEGFPFYQFNTLLVRLQTQYLDSDDLNNTLQYRTSGRFLEFKLTHCRRNHVLLLHSIPAHCIVGMPSSSLSYKEPIAWKTCVLYNTYKIFTNVYLYLKMLKTLFRLGQLILLKTIFLYKC